MLKKRLLLVEDEKSLREVIKLNLEFEGYEVIEGIDGVEAIKTFNNQRFDLIILDIMMPKIDGFKVCRKIRLQDSSIPILFLTAKGSTKERIEGLKIGADDYLAKPFDLEELLLRVKNLVKRIIDKSTRVEDIFKFGDNQINFTTYEAKNILNQHIRLTKKEVLLLKLLIDKENQVVSRKEILHHVWEYDINPSTRTVDNFILSFRKYFEKNPKKPIHFHSVRGVGYKFSKTKKSE